MSFRQTFWTRKRVKILVVVLILAGMLLYLVTFMFFSSFFHEHLAFSVFLLFGPTIASLWLFIFTCAPEHADWQIRVLRRFGYDFSEEEVEEVVKAFNMYNRLLVPSVLIYTVAWMFHLYFVESVGFRFLGEPIREGIHVYGFITYMFPLLFISIFIYWYTWRKYPTSRRIDKLQGELIEELRRKGKQEKFLKIMEEEGVNTNIKKNVLIILVILLLPFLIAIFLINISP